MPWGRKVHPCNCVQGIAEGKNVAPPPPYLRVKGGTRNNKRVNAASNVLTFQNNTTCFHNHCQADVPRSSCVVAPLTCRFSVALPNLAGIIPRIPAYPLRNLGGSKGELRPSRQLDIGLWSSPSGAIIHQNRRVRAGKARGSHGVARLSAIPSVRAA